MVALVGIATSTAHGDEPETDRNGRELRQPPVAAIDLRTLESPPFSNEALRDELISTLARVRPDLARALAAPQAEQIVSVPLPESLVAEPEPIAALPNLGSETESGAATAWALFSTAPATRLTLPHLSTIKAALTHAREGQLVQADGDLIIVAADHWIRSVSAVGGQGVEDSLDDLGVRFEHDSYYGLRYCGTLLEPLVKRPNSTPFARRAFIVLLDEGWLGACRDDFGDNALGNDLFMAVIEHGERFLAEYPDSPIRSAVALRAALAHETAWSIDKWDPTYFYHDAWNPEIERTRAIELYEVVMRETPPGELRTAVEERLDKLRRNQDTGCRVYYLESGC
jgi:hypothetical protein